MGSESEMIGEVGEQSRASNLRYRAFISNSHKDKRLAARLHQALQGYSVPKEVAAAGLGENRKLGRFFRDDEEMGAAESLGAAIEGAIDDSENLVVLCSPSAAKSKWVDAEVRRFKRRSGAKVFAVIAKGCPGSGDPKTECFVHKQMGLSLGHTCQVLSYGFGLSVSRGGLYRALARMADRAQPTYDQLVETARQAPVNGMDETGWKVGGRLQWLHVAVSAQVTVYAILPGRGYGQSVAILGAAYDGFLIHDGWAPYYRFALAFHQSCLAHLLKRCREMAQVSSSSALAFPRAVEHLLETSLELRDRYARGEISEHGVRSATGKLEAQLDRMLGTHRQNAANRRLARHLEHERLWLFTFLHCPGLDATNNAAERAIRGMVIARKVWGGNRTWEGARTQQILVSVLRTCWQQGKDAFTRGVRLLRAPRAMILDIVPCAD
jgi:transposase